MVQDKARQVTAPSKTLQNPSTSQINQINQINHHQFHQENTIHVASISPSTNHLRSQAPETFSCTGRRKRSQLRALPSQDSTTHGDENLQKPGGFTQELEGLVCLVMENPIQMDEIYEIKKKEGRFGKTSI